VRRLDGEEEVAADGQPVLGDLKFHMISEVAEALRVSKMTVYRLVNTGDLEAVRIGRSFRVTESSLRAYLKKRVVIGTAEQA
jgi:excisionase family DNA binding protein